MYNFRKQILAASLEMLFNLDVTISLMSLTSSNLVQIGFLPKFRPPLFWKCSVQCREIEKSISYLNPYAYFSRVYKMELFIVHFIFRKFVGIPKMVKHSKVRSSSICSNISWDCVVVFSAPYDFGKKKLNIHFNVF